MSGHRKEESENPTWVATEIGYPPIPQPTTSSQQNNGSEDTYVATLTDKQTRAVSINDPKIRERLSAQEQASAQERQKIATSHYEKDKISPYLSNYLNSKSTWRNHGSITAKPENNFEQKRKNMAAQLTQADHEVTVKQLTDLVSEYENDSSALWRMHWVGFKIETGLATHPNKNTFSNEPLLSLIKTINLRRDQIFLTEKNITHHRSSSAASILFSLAAGGLTAAGSLYIANTILSSSNQIVDAIAAGNWLNLGVAALLVLAAAACIYATAHFGVKATRLAREFCDARGITHCNSRFWPKDNKEEPNLAELCFP